MVAIVSSYSDAECALIARVEKKMELMMSKYDPSHDAHHVQRVRRTALSLAQSIATCTPEGKHKPDLLVVELAALMHDMLDKKYVSPELAANPEAFFLPLLSPQPGEKEKENLDLDLVSDGRAALISRIVDNVSWSTESKRRASGEWGTWHDSCIELHCVQDADRLDAIGAFGIIRCAAYSAAVNRPLHVPGGDISSAIGHFDEKLLHIRERMKTDAGKKMAEKRHVFMLQFLEAVDDEYAA